MLNGRVIEGLCRLTPSYKDGVLHVSFRCDLYTELRDIRRVQALAKKTNGPYATEQQAQAAIDELASAIRNG